MKQFSMYKGRIVVRQLKNGYSLSFKNAFGDVYKEKFKSLSGWHGLDCWMQDMADTSEQYYEFNQKLNNVFGKEYNNELDSYWFLV